ncbi:uncharacterized protein LOC113520130 [Galleria mellonella]|uniref:Uncharacterized protein LOC113520130 n=1 Tax=Galleria mellonella TaxID=7137 RepID=A0ABM3N0P0_GALME|nr:uncharacterized protein LOC113520130 [Galleria mellonella]
MAHQDGGRHSWDDEERFYSSGRDSDDSPILSYRHDKRRYAPYIAEERTEERGRRSTVTVLAKCFLFCSTMILFCVLMYIPVYNRANDQIPKSLVAGWSVHTNRDTKIYVQPNNVTTIHEPKDICPKSTRHKKNNLFLLIVVSSSTVNFDRRIAIRETWGSQENYIKMSKIFNAVRNKYKHYNYSYDLYTETDNGTANVSREKRDISSFSRLLPELAKALQNNLENIKTDDVPEEKRYDDAEKRFDDDILTEFDMNKELGDVTENDVDYYADDTNIMRIPPNGYDDTPDLEKILKMLKPNFPKNEERAETGNTEVDFRLVFLLGLPAHDNDTTVQSKIEEEVEKYGDIIQEGFIDSYNNLTLKSIMMLKWITNKCNESVRYILKTDDDMYINVPNLVLNLKNRSKEYDEKVSKGYKEKEHLLIGDLICGARPVLDSNNKWYSPRYMYGGRVYPRYLSGTGYVFSADAAPPLYEAALRTNYFHLEDIYITGMCALRARPRLVARDDAGFSYAAARGAACAGCAGCAPQLRHTVHRVPPAALRALQRQLLSPRLADRCERIRLTQIKSQQDRSFLLCRYLQMLISNKC